MTMTPEGRAAAVINRIERDGYRFLDDLSWHNESTLTSYIALAIREAEDAALETVRREISMAVLANIDDGAPEFLAGLQLVSDRIQALKHNKD